MKTQKTAKQIADEAQQYLDSACSDAAEGMITFPDLDETWGPRIRKAKRDGVRDLRGWLADELYNDAGFLEDFLGDRLCDLTEGDDALRNAALDELEKHAHDALKTACEKLRRDA